jgi:hypothetical protein
MGHVQAFFIQPLMKAKQEYILWATGLPALDRGRAKQKLNYKEKCYVHNTKAH